MSAYYVKQEEDEDELHDILNLSPPLLKGEEVPLNFGVNSGPNEIDKRYPVSEHTPPPAPTSNYHHSLPDPENLLNPLTIGYSSTGYSSNYLSPNSPGNQSSHSLYSDVSSNPASPFLSALSTYSNNYDNSANPQENFNGSNVDLRMSFGQQTYFDTNLGVFDSEIALGASVSSTNLMGMGYDAPSYQSQHSQPQSALNYQQGGPQYNQNATYLTENNLSNYNKTAPQIIYTNNDDDDDNFNVKQENPEEIVRRTPSLFSNSSHNSSINNSPNEDSNKLSPMYHSKNNKGSASSPGSVISDVSDQNKLLSPEEYHRHKRERRRSHTRSKSRSGSFSNEEPANVISSREKMLELASTNQISKRTQKHPSAYACHLCEKRFTRPYNLKSHLRTHTDERPFICNVCGKAFARQHDRKRHEDLHSGEKKFQCKGFLKDGTPYGCGRRFARADALRRHFQTEAGKECVRLLVEEDESEKKKGNPGSSMLNGVVVTDHLSPPNVPQVAISPPD